jgi:hypothetical protein
MATYTIIGGDGKEYGSVLADDLRRWIVEGRLNAGSLVKAESDAEFRPLSTFPEFADAFASQAPPVPFAPSPADVGDGREIALKLVKGPAIALIITASLGVAYYGFSGLFTLLTGGMMFHQELPPELPPQMRALIENMRGPMAGVISLAIAAVNGFVLFGAIKMLRLQQFGLVMTAVIVAMVPCQCCCLLGLPFGIWALVVLNKPEVKSHFG